MKFQGIEKFTSKRNQVILAKLPEQNEEFVVIKSFGDNMDAYKTELHVATALQSKGILTPKIFKNRDGQIIYQYIDGEIVLNLIDKLEQDGYSPTIYQIFDKLCLWLADCYKALEFVFQKPMILSDIHLRNFIFKEEIYGVDFECVKEGRVEEDIARLAAFTVTYSPEFTEQKYALAGFICSKSIEYMNLNYTLLIKELENQLEIIGKRRKIEYGQSVVENIRNRIDIVDNKIS